MSEAPSKEDIDQAKEQLITLLREVISYSRAENLPTFPIPITTLDAILDEWARLRALDLSTPREVYVAARYSDDGTHPFQAFLNVADAFAARKFSEEASNGSGFTDIFAIPVWPQPAISPTPTPMKEPDAA